ncbi:MAG: helicase [Gemmatimonadota bacterium]|nr:helicase [Gemmatimonadota bacterium]
MDIPLRLAPEAARVIRGEIARAGGREVSFLAEVSGKRVISNPRAVARGNRSAVLAVARDAPEGGVMIHNHPSGELEPSDADLAVAARIHEQGLGTAIVNNRATRIYVVVEPPEPRDVEPLRVDKLSGLLAPEGPLAKLPGYEDRPGQRDMLRFVASRFNEGGVGLVEAGTGTGKSLAYLVPAARWAVRNGERAVVSTNTINLQEQLVGKDLGIVREVVGEDFKWALMKGRGNYISIRRARLAADSAPDLFPDDRSAELEALLDWIDRTEDGSRSDLPFSPSHDVWEEVRSDTDACLRAKCPHFQQCHFQRARRTAAGADLIIVNHALFFSDLAVRMVTENFRDSAVLPSYRRVIFDEAHHMEDAATSRLGAETTRAGMFRTLSRIDRGGKGILASIGARLAGVPASITAQRLRKRIGGRAGQLVDEAREALNGFFEVIEPWVEGREGKGALRLGRPAKPGEPGGPEPVDEPAIAEALERVLITLGDLARELDGLAEQMGDQEEVLEVVEGRLLDLRGSRTRLENIDRALRFCLLPGDSDGPALVRWLEVRRSGVRRIANLVFAAAPVELGPTLATHLFGNTETAILTSATLAANNDFGYLRGRLGLAGGTAAPESLADSHSTDLLVAEAVVDSPFDHTTQSLLAIPTDLPSARNRAAAAAHHQATAQVIHDVARITGGGVFALFTSYAALRAVAADLRNRGAEGRWPLFVQGEGDRSALLRDFTRSGKAVLLGTASFWEGVDVPGRPLRALVIQKLPFRVPSEPMTEARIEAMEERGENSFRGYMVPDAAMRLKQGVGRLIRTRTDRGAVLILDDRLLRKRYGRDFLDALPPMPLVRGGWREVRGRVEEFYNRE